MILRSILDWFSYIVNAWLNDVFIKTEAEFQEYSYWWHIFAKNELSQLAYIVSPDSRLIYEIAAALVRFIAAGDYRAALDLQVAYMLDNLPSDNSLRGKIIKNPRDGYWEKR